MSYERESHDADDGAKCGPSKQFDLSGSQSERAVKGEQVKLCGILSFSNGNKVPFPFPLKATLSRPATQADIPRVLIFLPLDFGFDRERRFIGEEDLIFFLPSTRSEENVRKPMQCEALSLLLFLFHDPDYPTAHMRF